MAKKNPQTIAQREPDRERRARRAEKSRQKVVEAIAFDSSECDVGPARGNDSVEQFVAVRTVGVDVSHQLRAATQRLGAGRVHIADDLMGHEAALKQTVRRAVGGKHDVCRARPKDEVFHVLVLACQNPEHPLRHAPL